MIPTIWHSGKGKKTTETIKWSAVANNLGRRKKESICGFLGQSNHSSVLAWRIPGVGEPGGLPSMGSHRVGHNWGDLAAAAAATTLCITVMTEACYYTFVKTHRTNDSKREP